MSKEKKLAKKEKKAAKKAAKLEKSQAAAYAKLVKNIDKKNAKAEKKANKKGKPFVPTPIPSQEEAFASASGGKVGKIILMIILILLIVYLAYFLVMWFKYEAPKYIDNGTETSDESKAPVEYDRYKNEHKITTTPTYSVSQAKVLLKQVLHDNWSTLGYSSDPSSGSINYTSNIVNVNNMDCYIFTAGSKTYAVSIKLSAVYVYQNGTYNPLTFHDSDILF